MEVAELTPLISDPLGLDGAQESADAAGPETPLWEPQTNVILVGAMCSMVCWSQLYWLRGVTCAQPFHVWWPHIGSLKPAVTKVFTLGKLDISKYCKSGLTLEPVVKQHRLVLSTLLTWTHLILPTTLRSTRYCYSHSTDVGMEAQEV